jgi:hypothetical protein
LAEGKGQGAAPRPPARANSWKRSGRSTSSMRLDAEAENRVADLDAASRRPPRRTGPGRSTLLGRIWVTRRGIHIDRIASRLADPEILDPRALPLRRPEGAAAKGEVRFDMVGGDFSTRRPLHLRDAHRAQRTDRPGAHGGRRDRARHRSEGRRSSERPEAPGSNASSPGSPSPIRRTRRAWNGA